MHISRLLLSVLFILVACTKEVGLELHSCYEEYLCTPDGSIMKWQQSTVNFHFEDAAPEALRLAMGDAALDYNDFFTQTTIRVDPKSSGAPRYKTDTSLLNRDRINGIYYVKGYWPWTEKIPGSLAVTLTRFDAQGIIEADIFIKEDPSKFDSANDDVLPWIHYISSHELGHALGRSHSKDQSSIMYPSISLNKVLNLFSEEDFHDFFSDYDIDLFGLAYK